mmetsp:Transcript_1265/g.2638  ORF Transcript_1265/g.2638 Transcript_1265/m.2638 type:complete len:561 (-) Transcript_1265:76-1758(-)
MNFGSYFFVVCILAFLAVAKCSYFGKNVGWSLKGFPNPMTDPLQCGRKEVPRSQICDPDGILDRTAQDEIEGHINFIKSGQAAVVIIKKMKLSELDTDVEKAAEKFCRSLHDQWGVGSKETNDGIVVLVSVEDRAVFISTGDGAKSRITDQLIDGIIHRMKPFLRRSDYGGALINAIIEVEMAFSGKELPKYSSPHSTSTDPDNSWIFKTILFISVSLGFAYFAHIQSEKLRKMERGRIALDSLIREVENTTEDTTDAQGKVFRAASCPICLEDFPTPIVGDGATASSGSDAHTSADVDSDFGGGDDQDSELLRNLGPTPTTPVFTSRAPPPKPSKPMALRCGHTFCYECITTHLKTDAGKRCPICRFPVHKDYDGMDPRPPTQPGRPVQPGGGNHNQQQGSDDGTSCARNHSAGGAPPMETLNTDTPSRVNQDPMYMPADSPASPTTNIHHHHHHRNNNYYFNSGIGARRPELLYRMNRMRYLYPDVMTAQLLSTMNRAVERGSLDSMRAELSSRSVEVQRTVTQMKVASEKAARSSGRGGSSGSFGGGRSSGGGGGRW